MRARLINLLKPVPSIYANGIQSSALPKLPLTRISPRKRSSQGDEHTTFLRMTQ